ncbi:MAG TPA: mechanosensitive ion channel family protein [Gemmatimonadales bacterium]|nr:mechanosensitive ion channel family protein [Gemmatimonadales bacterium]
MNELWDRIGSLDPVLRGRVAETIAILLVLMFVRWLLFRFVVPQVTDTSARFRIRKVITYILVITGLLLAARAWSGGLAQIGAFFGIVTAGLAIALNQPLTNLAGWLFILWRRPFRLGDRIQIDQYLGDVTDIRLFQFAILEVGNWVDADQHTGRVIHLPNGLVFTRAQANYTTALGLLWNEIMVTVTFESDWQAAKAILTEIIGRHTLQGREGTMRPPPPARRWAACDRTPRRGARRDHLGDAQWGGAHHAVSLPPGPASVERREDLGGVAAGIRGQ